MRVTCLHGGWLASLPEALRDDLIAALTPAQARALLYEWLFCCHRARSGQSPIGGINQCRRCPGLVAATDIAGRHYRL